MTSPVRIDFKGERKSQSPTETNKQTEIKSRRNKIQIKDKYFCKCQGLKSLRMLTNILPVNLPNKRLFCCCRLRSACLYEYADIIGVDLFSRLGGGGVIGVLCEGAKRPSGGRVWDPPTVGTFSKKNYGEELTKELFIHFNIRINLFASSPPQNVYMDIYVSEIHVSITSFITCTAIIDSKLNIKLHLPGIVLSETFT